jgi:hypothetical protein
MNVDLAALELFFGDANAAETRIYARLAGLAPGNGLSLSGKLTGPLCVYSQTLPAMIPLVDQGPGAALLAQAIVPDPCFWSPELPMLYNAHVELRRGHEVLGQIDRTVGIRPLGARGQRLVYEGKTWVLRAVTRQAMPETELEQWREVGAAMYVRQPDDTLLQQASRVGVLIMAEVNGGAEEVASELRRLSRWPAVGLASVSCNEPLPIELRAHARNMVLIADSHSAPWAHAIMLSELCVESGRHGLLPCIVLATRQRRSAVAILDDLSAARRECDALQRDLAVYGQFAGYLI